MPDRNEVIQDLIHEHQDADKDALLCSLFNGWQDVSGTEFQAAIDAVFGVDPAEHEGVLQ